MDQASSGADFLHIGLRNNLARILRLVKVEFWLFGLLAYFNALLLVVTQGTGMHQIPGQTGESGQGLKVR